MLKTISFTHVMLKTISFTHVKLVNLSLYTKLATTSTISTTLKYNVEKHGHA